ncbi:N-Acetyl-D-glucosamine ABC transport system permease protein 1 [Lactococcus lactis subsp. lactis]|jgi:multiple sugar transport system permease protein|uniref:N-Acetyl-D-glucosamine ABC transport system permease protein 1 n=1 Tax=Lactococcus lactis subsp. cremoris TaxID=1359 RepID=A0A166JN05_LACLC|nr:MULTISPECIES: sugar ABC transporter permease [Lactococcus]KST79330.1 N-Acetyl-D-glucosamine ABC transport system permease protein 1 [Lactococcus lactis subsp. lactis]KZK06434.1 N-Acetyl-D-glucosamine ABC transport system permease protein 1 [Lactococcus cremoris]
MKKKNNLLWVLLFLGPSLVGFLTFIAVPILYSLYISFTDWNLLTSAQFVGFKNYISLFKDATFWSALRNTVTFIIGYLPSVMIFGLLIALLLNSKIKFKTLFRGIYFLPVVTSWVAVSLVWKWLLNGQYGLINYFLSLVGIHGPSWLTDPKTAMIAVIITSVWKDIGFIMVLYLGGLQNISPSLYEAAEIDGANSWHSFWNVTLPGLRPTTFFVIMISLINSFQVFDQVNIMTGGGPGNATNVMVQNIYNSAFNFFEMGRASAMSWILFLIIFGVSLVQMWGERKAK